MKRISIIIIFISIVLGCRDVLDKVPLDTITEKTYWTSSDDIKLFINGFYPAFIGDLIDHERYEQEYSSDNMLTETPDLLLNGTRIVPATGGGWDWKNIRSINYFLGNVDKATQGSKLEISQFKGEGFFFRAYFYFTLLQNFGDVPWYDVVLTTESEELYTARDPRNIIMDHIVADLDQAISLLNKRNEVGPNRINWEAALLFKSRVCLYEGTWEKYHAGTVFGVQGSNGQKYLQLAAESAGTLINSGNISLYSTNHPEKDYFTLFGLDDLAAAGGAEALLIDTRDPGLQMGRYTAYNSGMFGNASGITKSMVDSYLSIDGLPISLSSLYQGDSSLIQVSQNRDPRMYQSIWIRGQVRAAQDPPILFMNPPLNSAGKNGATTGYMVRKGSTPDPVQNIIGSTNGKVDGIVFRYAEALLNYAEAKAELNTVTQEDLDKSINLVKRRVGMPDLTLSVGFVDPNWQFPELSPLINEIRRERRVELAFEGFRTADLMRWAAGDLIEGKRWLGARFILGKSFPEIEDMIQNMPVDASRYIEPYQKLLPNGYGFKKNRDYLFPIPSNELVLNKNLTQNPGW